MADHERLLAELDEAERKAIDSLARYKFAMFGYWAGIWIHLNRISDTHRPNPFTRLVVAAREMRKPQRAIFHFDERSEITIRDMLLLVDVDVPEEQISTWTVGQTLAATTWAGLLHLAANDNQVRVPAKPEFLRKPGE